LDLGLDGKVALVAGGSSGIGLAIALELAREGAHVAICGRDEGRLRDAERTLKEQARAVVRADSLDLTDRGAASRWADDVAAGLGALHVVVIGGGTPAMGRASVFGTDAYQAAVDLVLLPAVSLALTALPHLRAARWGRILFIASETVAAPVASLALSGVTRAALARFAQGLAADAGPDGITVNVLAPGWTRTPLTERTAARLAGDGDADGVLRAIGARNAVGRVARPDEIAAVAAFLASERASYITGGVHLIDGGASLMGHGQPHHEEES
jgi:3-oxoacyl-[acyl-carrier protein] reductase